MTETAATDFLQAWSEALARVLGQISGSAFPCVVRNEAPAEMAPPADGDFWMVCVCSGGLRGEMSLRLPAASTLRLAQIFMSEPAAPEAQLTADHGQATLELLRQVAGLVASTLTASWGETQLGLELSAVAPSWTASSSAWIQAGENSPTWLEAHLSAALAATLRMEKEKEKEKEKTEAAAAPAATPAAATAAPPASAPARPPTPLTPEQSKIKLDLLLDVELALTLRFGSRSLLLRQVLDLNPGSVIDLDRQVEEPVDVLLDGRLVARGEVVVLDGNYGVRVTEVAPAGV